MISKIQIIILLAFGTCTNSCTHPVNLIGSWQIKGYSPFEYLYYRSKGITSFIVYGKLKLNPDSSFVDSLCGGTYYGKWTVKNDTLVLTTTQLVFRPSKFNNDTALTASNKTSRLPKPIKYRIERHQLVYISYTYTGYEDRRTKALKKRKHKTIEIMRKN